MKSNTFTSTWTNNLSALEWDRNLAALGGHPLQSALWGEARYIVDGIDDQRLVHYSKDGSIDGLARVETRRLPFIGKIAWIPKGPTLIKKERPTETIPQLRALLATQGYWVCIDDIYESVDPVSSVNKPQTIWLDISLGRGTLLKNLDQQWRYGVRVAERAGVIVEQGTPDDISPFFSLCEKISKSKGFQLPGSELLMRNLLDFAINGDVFAHLFIARYKGILAAGAFIIRCGRSIHYFWGASDRTFSKERPGEALQWGIIEWALQQGIEKYDLEGIDPLNNPGVAAFKKKMGGAVISLSGKKVYPLNLIGNILVFAGKKLRKI